MPDRSAKSARNLAFVIAVDASSCGKTHSYTGDTANEKDCRQASRFRFHTHSRRKGEKRAHLDDRGVAQKYGQVSFLLQLHQTRWCAKKHAIVMRGVGVME